MGPVKVVELNPRIDLAWRMIRTTLERAAPPTVKMTEHLISKLRTKLLLKEATAWLFGDDDGPIAVAVTMSREDELLDKKEVLIYAAANLRRMTNDEWDQCFAKMRLHALSRGCTHLTCMTVVKRIIEMAERMGGDTSTRYVSIPLGG